MVLTGWVFIGNGHPQEKALRAAQQEAIAESRDARLHAWKPATSQKVRALVAEIIALADDDALDIARSRAVEQEVLDLLDEPKAP